MTPRLLRALLCTAVLAVASSGCVAAVGRSPWQRASWQPPRVQEQPVRNVLAIHWGNEDFPANITIDAGIREVLLSPGSSPLAYYAEYLESDRFPEDTASLALRDYIGEKYAGRRIDVVIANTDPALRFVLRYRGELFPDAPIVFVGVAAPDPYVHDDGPGIATVLRGGFAETLRLALELHPWTRQVFVVARAPTFSLADSALADLQGVAGDVTLTYLTDGPAAQILQSVHTAPPDSLVLYIRYSQETAGEVIIPSDIARRVAEASPVPVYGTSDVFIGNGVVGGMVYTQHGLGIHAAEIVRRILAGTRPQDIPIARAPLNPTFDWRQLQRWGIDPARLPAGSQIRFQVPSAWELYRWYIVGALSVFTVQALLIGGLLVERLWRHRAEREAKRTREELAHVARVSTMGELAASLAHELNQPLTGILGNARAATRLLAAGKMPEPELREILDDIVDDDKRAAEVIARMRDLVSKRTPERAPLNLNDVVQSIAKLVASDSIIRQVTITLDLAPVPLLVDGDRVQLQQVVLNLLLNALEAASLSEDVAHKVTVSTSPSTANAVHLVVRDNGPGLLHGTEARVFEPFYTTKGTGMGMGLAIARSIVESHGGRIWAANGSSRGAEFHVVLPRLAEAPARLTRRSA